MYFKSFSKIDYDVTGTGQTNTVTDIISRIVVRKSLTDSMALFTKYIIEEEESPEMVALKFYEQVDLHWIILLFNSYFDRYYDWPMSTRALQLYTADKYENPNEIHHWEMPQSSGDKNTKLIIDSLNQYEASKRPDATFVTNFEYETNLNDSRKSIKIFEPSYVSAFVSEFKSKF